jgi:deoxyribose-phosphate aldolase
LCEICSEHHAAFVKTSTGYGFVKQENGMYAYQGATEHNLKLMRKHSSASVQLKAASILLSTKITITEAAYLVGFRDSAVFARAFKNRFGCSASSWVNNKNSRIHQAEDSGRPWYGTCRRCLF